MKEVIKAVAVYMIVSLMVALLTICIIDTAKASEQITNESGIVITTCDHDAGAICSLKWKNKEFLNDFDHGRQMQSAVVLNRQGEALNPTEAGASYLTDGFNPSPSSSKNLISMSSGGLLVTSTQMAYWNPVNGQKLSNFIHTKYVKLGYKGLPNVIEYITSFQIPTNETYWYAQFEVLTGYMPKEFSMFWSLDIKNGQTIPQALDDGPGEQPLPVIMSTVDRKYAMGIYSPDSPQPHWNQLGYGRFRFIPEQVVKWNNVYRVYDPKGVQTFKSYVVVGSLDEVVRQMSMISRTLKKVPR